MMRVKISVGVGWLVAAEEMEMERVENGISRVSKMIRSADL